MLVSTPNHLYNHLSDEELTSEFLKYDLEFRKAVSSGDDFLADTIDAIIFQIDDELCARGLDLPNIDK